MFADEIKERHKKEKKELLAKIQGLKKAKVDKKRKKEILEEIIKLEEEQLAKHAAELSKLDLNKDAESVEKTETIENVPSMMQRISKAQKRRDKKLFEEKERELLVQAGEEENKNGPRILETKALTNILKARELQTYAIPSDGNCLFAAVKHQLVQNGKGFYEVEKLRSLTADYILQNKDTLIFYMSNDDGEIYSDLEYENYCEQMRNTKAWGGQVEIQALSNVLKVPIEVLQATGPPTITGTEYSGRDNPNAILTYHRHIFSLGEHYNSTQPMQDENSENED